MIYAVVNGEYSDYHVHAIFTTKEKAQAYAERMNQTTSDRGCEVAEFRLDPEPPEVYVQHRAWIDLATRAVHLESSGRKTADPPTGPELYERAPGIYNTTQCVTAKTPEDALAGANEVLRLWDERCHGRPMIAGPFTIRLED